ncbi:hypothetical protein ASPZODRAFT_14285 [Penicilliopsis zonata CBS 506.65]|uniref:Zn(2)-C6 fungal-type domain-containing protein n=1 Tax=Penicilliopsis zonata CBS 506.65 TaxID=1073090 RepID=A0A1L9SM55_9EURO|nr:hypothetical protein ASPZODRAFT_14285 [Penicilliopsis zonata CBS 506.65]OJJ48134.1 hypothetical protein ASPZODRAFT_14285 [Penicilliopsis zonata CBS 506.65]
MGDPLALFRNIAPLGSEGGGGGGSSTESRETGRERQGPVRHWKKRVSTACLACKKSKRKCSGVAPCENCRTFNRVCIFDESLDQRRRVAAKRTADELNYHRDLLNDLFTVIRSEDPGHAQRLMELIRGDASADEVRGYVDETLRAMKAGTLKREEDDGDDEDEDEDEDDDDDDDDDDEEERHSEVISRLEDLQQLWHLEEPTPAFRRKVMDLHYLCDDAPYKVPARPWTTVTADDDLVSHLVSLYFTWDYPFYAFLDLDVFVRHMARGDLASDFCSPFLVNALLANACHFSEFSEAYVVPGDIMTKGADFLAEAERLQALETQQQQQQQQQQPTLASLQATLMLYERYSMSGKDDLGYIMLHRSVQLGEALGLVNGSLGGRLLPEYRRRQLSVDMDRSLKRSAWGLFQADTIAHTSFLRSSLVHRVDVNRLHRNESQASDLWTPYPSHRAPRPVWLSQYFDESCDLCFIARDISREMFSEGRTCPLAGEALRKHRQVFYARLRRWEERLPATFDLARRPAPHILLLRMRYHTLVINLFSHEDVDYDSSSMTSSAGSQREISPTTTTATMKPGSAAIMTATLRQSSARAIAQLARLHRSEYGMRRAHSFAMYAINLALFALLELDAFDILDPDFLSLASAFSIVASRSLLGRNLFHIFRQSVRAKNQGRRARESASLPDELKELFDEQSAAHGCTRWDEYAQGLQKLNEHAKYHGIGNAQRSLQDYPGFRLYDMLDRYESLSLGKDDLLPERHKPDGL